MSSLTSRSIVLISARLANYAALMLSPVFLVRILDVNAYGQYREFVLYSLLIATILSFRIKSNLLYFIPKDHARESTYVANSIFFIFLTSIVGLTPVLFAKESLLGYVDFDFVGILAVYVFFYINLDIVESYWLAKKRSDYVFVYSTTLLLIRIATVIATAYWSRDVIHILYAMTAVEMVKFFLLAYWWTIKRNVRLRFNKEAAVHQIRFIVPLGVGGLIATLGQKFGSVFVASALGTTALAVYSIGVYQIPVLSIIRSAVSDVIFPDMAAKDNDKKPDALVIWQRANVIFCFLVFPIFFIFWVYADRFILFMFTDKYVQSIPVFQVMLLLMIRQCFELGTPLRSRNKNKYFYKGNLIALFFNVAFTLALYPHLGLLAPAIAFVLSDILMAGYLSLRIMELYAIPFSAMFMWNKIGIIGLAAVIGIPALITGEHYGSVPAITLSIIGYLVIYYLIIRKFRVAEVELVINKLNGRLRNIR